MVFSTYPYPETAILALESSGVSVPDMIKIASPLDEDVTPLYADSARTLPIESGRMAILSSIQYLANAPDLDSSLVGRLRKAAHAYQMGQLFDQAAQFFIQQRALSSVQKSAAIRQETAPVWALSEQDGGPAYRIKTALDVESSADGMARDLQEHNLSATQLFRASRALMKRAHELGVDPQHLPRRIVGLGTERLPDWDAAEAHLLARDHRGYDRASSETAGEIIKSARAGLMDPEQACDLWAQLDEHCGVRPANTPTPHEIVYSGTTADQLLKLANHALVLDGVTLPADALRPAQDERLLRRLSREEAECLNKMASMVQEGNGAVASCLAANLPVDVSRRMLRFLAEAPASKEQ